MNTIKVIISRHKNQLCFGIWTHERYRKMPSKDVIITYIPYPSPSTNWKIKTIVLSSRRCLLLYLVDSSYKPPWMAHSSLRIACYIFSRWIDRGFGKIDEPHCWDQVTSENSSPLLLHKEKRRYIRMASLKWGMSCAWLCKPLMSVKACNPNHIRLERKSMSVTCTWLWIILKWTQSNWQSYC